MTLGVAVVGLGVGEAHARAFAAHPACRLRSVVDLDAAKAARVSAAIGQGGVAPDLAAVLADPGVDIVSIATYDDAHAAQTVAALEAGKHVFVEKPICTTLDELRSVKAAWVRAGRLKLSSNLVLRAAPLYVWLKEELASGRLGRAYAFDGDYLYGRVEKITEGWRKDLPDYSVMAGGGIHLVDLLLSLRGARPTTVHAVGTRIATEGTAFRYDDHVAATLSFPDGLVARVSANFGCTHRHQHVVRVYGTRGTFVHDDAGARVHRSRDPAVAPEPLAYAAKPESKGALVGAFVDAVAKDEDLRAHTQGIFDAMAVCIAIDQARKTGVPTRVEYP